MDLRFPPPGLGSQEMDNIEKGKKNQGKTKPEGDKARPRPAGFSQRKLRGLVANENSYGQENESCKDRALGHKDFI